MRTTPRGSLERRLPPIPTTDKELFLMRRAAWKKQGVLVVSLDDAGNDIERQVLVNVATRLYGPRP